MAVKLVPALIVVALLSGGGQAGGATGTEVSVGGGALERLLSSVSQRTTATTTTRIPATTYSSNTTWTLAGSPYILDGSVTVAAGATLTINPGVVVKLNGQFRTLTVNGTLKALGTSSSHVVFTSLQDDSIGGDDGGDGPTVGAPGQWYNIAVSAGTASQLQYVDVRYGGYGSTNWNYGAVSVSGSGTAVSIDHATIASSQTSGVKVGLSSSATVTDSTLAFNGNGVSVNTATVTLDRSTISDSSQYGVWFNLPNFNPLPAASKMTASEITRSGLEGIYIGANGDYPLASLPTGTGNNIYANKNGGTQLTVSGYPGFGNADVNWRGNYWGENVYYWFNAKLCTGTNNQSTGHLAYRGSGGNVPAGPIDSGSYYVQPDVFTVYYCGWDRFKIGKFWAQKLDAGARASLAQTFGTGIHGINPTVVRADPVNSATGSFTHELTDLTLPGTGVSFGFTRSYNSLDLTKAALGQGWTHSYAAALTIAANGDVTLRGEDGQQLEYTKQADGSFVGAAGALSTLATVTGGYELTRKDQVKYRFDTQGRLTSIKDRNDQGVALAYDGNGRLQTATDAAGRAATFTHDGNGLLTGISLPDGRSVAYAYSNGLLSSVTDAAGKVWTYTYELHGWLEKEIDPLQHTVVRNVYTADGRVVEQYDALNNKTTLSWDQATQTETATDARGNAWKDVYASNVLAKRIDALGNTTQFGHDTSLNGTSVASPTGQTTTMSYDSRGNLLTAVAPSSLNAQKTFAYNARNDVTSVTDARGKVTSYGYDTAGNNTSISQDGQTVATYAHDAAGRVTSSTDGRGNTTTYTYDANGKLASETDPLGNKTTYTYDAAGRMTSKVKPLGNVQGADPNQYKWTYTHDGAGRLLTETNPLGQTTTYTYDGAGNKLTEKDARNNTTSYAYDAANRLVSETAPDPPWVCWRLV